MMGVIYGGALKQGDQVAFQSPEGDWYIGKYAEPEDAYTAVVSIGSDAAYFVEFDKLYMKVLQ